MGDRHLANNQHLIAIDLGSNSFHLLVGHYSNNQLALISKHREKIELAAGLTQERYLSDTAIKKALDCIKHFSHVIDEHKPIYVRALGTKTLRDAINSNVFIKPAEELLNAPVEVISGHEEARLIYLGAINNEPKLKQSSQLVVDIGGGSTELIVGDGEKVYQLHSVSMGCVVYKQRYFTNTKVTENTMAAAQKAAQIELIAIEKSIKLQDWQQAIGTSGTAQTVAAVLSANNLTEQNTITRQGLEQLKQQLIEFKSLDNIAMAGLTPDRAHILPAGVAILLALFDAFHIDTMTYVEGALREGILYDLLERGSLADQRIVSINKLIDRFSLTENDELQQRIAMLFSALQEHWQLFPHHGLFLQWAGMLHSLGKAIAAEDYSLHGAYHIKNAELPGFSRYEQLLLAFLIEAHHGPFPSASWQQLPAREKLNYGRLAAIIRLAYLTTLLPADIEINASNMQNRHLNILATPHNSAAIQLVLDALEHESQVMQQSPLFLTYTISLVR